MCNSGRPECGEGPSARLASSRVVVHCTASPSTLFSPISFARPSFRVVSTHERWALCPLTHTSSTALASPALSCVHPSPRFISSLKTRSLNCVAPALQLPHSANEPTLQVPFSTLSVIVNCLRDEFVRPRFARGREGLPGGAS